VHQASGVGRVERLRDLVDDRGRRLGSSRPFWVRILRRSTPSTKRIAMNSVPSASPTAWTGITFGCSI
jgi:hypothetical protein